MNQKIVLFISLFIATASFVVQYVIENSSAKKSDPLSSNEPDYFVENMHRFSFGSDGKIQNELQSVLVKHFPHNDSLEFKAPNMKIYENKGMPWNVVSDSAWVNSERTLILLNGKVYIWRISDTGKKEYEIITSDLTIKPNEKFAHTKKPAKITTRGVVTNTVGLKVVFKEGRVQLSDRVRTVYEPK